MNGNTGKQEDSIMFVDPQQQVNEQAAVVAAAVEEGDIVAVAVATSDHDHCLVCYSTLDYPGITICNHNEICGICHLRLRYLHTEMKCSICKEELEKVIVVDNRQRNNEKLYQDYPIWGNELGTDFSYRQDVNMFFPIQYYQQEIQPLFGVYCTVDNCSYTTDENVKDTTSAVVTTNDEDDDYKNNTEDDQGEDFDNINNNNNDNTNANNNNNKNKKKAPIKLLQDHLKYKHRLQLCNLCIEHKRDFIARLQRFTTNQLKKHLMVGDGKYSGFDGHPLCEFCKPKRFYDLQHLHMHLNKEHYKCHVCEKMGFQNQFFKNYMSLEKHFDKQHFLCHDVNCLSARFVVFDNELDLLAHERSVHGATASGSSKIQIEFRVRRPGYDDGANNQNQQQIPSENDFNYGLDGQAFVPADLPTSGTLLSSTGGGGGGRGNNNTNVRLHPMHLQRTAQLQAQAAQIRSQQQQQEEQLLRENAFPTLGQASSTTTDQQQNQLRIGWTSDSALKHVALANQSKKKAGVVTEEDFPSLPTPAKKINNKSKLINTKKQFAAINAAAAAPMSHQRGGGYQPPPSWGGGSAAVTGAAGMTTPGQSSSLSNNFPALATTKRFNRQEDLAPDNFPSLGPPPARPKGTTTPANAFMSAAAGKKPPPPLGSSFLGVKALPKNNIQKPVDVNSLDNFPSLGGGSKKKAATAVTKKKAAPPAVKNRFTAIHKYAAAETLAKKKSAPEPDWSSDALDFSSASISPNATTTATTTSPAKKKPPPPQKPPALDSTIDFPPVSATAPKKQPQPQQPLLLSKKNAGKKQQAPPPLDSTIDFPPPPGFNSNKNTAAAAAKSSTNTNNTKQQQPKPGALPLPSENAIEMVKNMQTTLGNAKYKQLKKLTKQFAMNTVGQLSPQEYIDQSVLLFENQYNDPNFWIYIPILLNSCPNEVESKQALHYMEQQKKIM